MKAARQVVPVLWVNPARIGGKKVFARALSRRVARIMHLWDGGEPVFFRDRSGMPSNTRCGWQHSLCLSTELSLATPAILM